MDFERQRKRKGLAATFIIIICAIITSIAKFRKVAEMNQALQVIMLHGNADPSTRKRRKEMEDRCRNIMGNLYTFHESPTIPIGFRDRFEALVEDPARNYCRKLTHMFEWEINEDTD